MTWTSMCFQPGFDRAFSAKTCPEELSPKHLKCKRIVSEVSVEQHMCVPLERLIYARHVFYDANSSPSAPVKGFDHDGIADFR